MRKSYEMTQAQLDKILEAYKSAPTIALNCGMPSSPHARVKAVWAELGKEMGFDHMSVCPAPGGDRFFTAMPVNQGSPT